MIAIVPADRVDIAVTDSKTGFIKQVVHVHRDDGDQQHQAWPGHEAVDVTYHTRAHGVAPHPALHRIDLKTKLVIDRTKTLEELRGEKHREIEQAFRNSIHVGLHYAEDFTAHRTEARARFASLKSKIEKAKNISSIEAIQWGT